jgi:hypothetical protein
MVLTVARIRIDQQQPFANSLLRELGLSRGLNQLHQSLLQFKSSMPNVSSFSSPYSARADRPERWQIHILTLQLRFGLRFSRVTLLLLQRVTLLLPFDGGRHSDIFRSDGRPYDPTSH